MMAVALDLDELEQYWQYLLAGGKKKDFRWSSPDRAGTAPLAGGYGNAGPDPSVVAEQATRLFSRGAVGLKEARKLAHAGSFQEFAQRTKRKMIKRYEYPDGRVEYRDEDDNVVNVPDGAQFAGTKEG